MMWPFYLMALVAIVSTIRVITNSNPVHALLSLIMSLLAVAGVFLTIGAPFAAALEIIVYAGAIMVLFVFVVMMLNLGSNTIMQEKSWLNSSAWAWPAAMGFIMALILIWMISNPTTDLQPMGTVMIGPKEVGIALFTKYLLLVEISAMLLLASLVAAYHLGKRNPSAEEKELG
jgi:NADH-quinone oxidoreductase subunit J